MLGVMLGKLHSYFDLGMLLKRYPQISPPEPKTKTVDIPGADGVLDLSRALTGRLQYKRRTIQMDYTLLARREHWSEMHSRILDALHGKVLDIILDDDPEYCYTGSVTVQGYDPGKVTSDVTIRADVEPYKTRISPTRVSIDVSGSKAATIQGSRKPVCPVIRSSAGMQMACGGKTYALCEGENQIDDILLTEGANAFSFTGDGTVVLEYREGRL